MKCYQKLLSKYRSKRKLNVSEPKKTPKHIKKLRARNRTSFVDLKKRFSSSSYPAQLVLCLLFWLILWEDANFTTSRLIWTKHLHIINSLTNFLLEKAVTPAPTREETQPNCKPHIPMPKKRKMSRCSTTRATNLTSYRKNLFEARRQSNTKHSRLCFWKCKAHL